jgi:tRNA pseudouridine38-40 synthase
MLKFSYDGSLFYGYQKQLNKRTVQGEVEKVISKIFNEEISIHASGRTDRGVHALNQTAHFDSLKIKETSKLLNSINKMLPPDIFLKELKETSLHARFDVKTKTYVYKINVGLYNALERNYVYQYNQKLDIKKMKKALKSFLGKHNFKSFTKENKEITDYERTIYKAKLVKRKNYITLVITGDGFLRYMVRNIVGLLLEIGSLKKDIKEVKRLFIEKNRTLAGITAPSCGLYLKEVKYKQTVKN